MLLFQLVINGLQVGAVYALTAAGFSLIFGATRVFHVAHGATFVLAAYIIYFMQLHGFGIGLGIAVACVVAILFGVCMDVLVYGPIQRHEGSFFTVFVASFGVAIAVQNSIAMIFGRSFVTIATPLSRSVEIMDGIYVAPLTWVAFACAAVIFAILAGLNRTRSGAALRALADNPELVRVFGLNPRHISHYAFALGSLLVVPAAAIAGATSGLSPNIGNHVMLISLAATIVGGVGSIVGALLAGLLIGLAQSLALLAFDSAWTEATTFAVLFLFIIFRPYGILGQKVSSH
ncbi:MAG: branched-chain amino acid ABC transporter permease [Rhizobiaceae bacterium]|nr:branched-chain amino acid ABC transporter permease [Rhizobiaceae bacterium]